MPAKHVPVGQRSQRSSRAAGFRSFVSRIGWKTYIYRFARIGSCHLGPSHLCLDCYTYVALRHFFSFGSTVRHADGLGDTAEYLTGSLQRRWTKSLRDIPLRGGNLLIAMQLGRASTVGRAEPCITVAEAKYSSTVEHELRCFGRRRRSPTSSLCEVMRNAVLGATPVPGCPSRPHRSVHVSYSCFAGLQHGLRSGSQLPVETWVLPFCASRWSHK